MRAARLAWIASGLLAGCAGLRERPPEPEAANDAVTVVRPVEAHRRPPPRPTGTPLPGSRYSMLHDAPPEPSDIPAGVENTPDAEPRWEPLSRSGNAPVYTVFGQTYRVLESAKGYKERGGASWYGRKFHGHTTASGEPYDMFAMTAAHRSLPLPSYVRVTNLANGRSVIVRVNDRGPFHPGRIIDLSYAAAARLDMIDKGHAQVEVEAIVPDDRPLHRPPHREDPEAPGYWQVASFIDPINAVNLRERLLEANVGPSAIWVEEDGSVAWHRVVVGPFGDERAASGARSRLQRKGFSPRWIVP